MGVKPANSTLNVRESISIPGPHRNHFTAAKREFVIESILKLQKRTLKTETFKSAIRTLSSITRIQMHGQKSNSGIWYSIPFPGQTNGETTESSELTSHRANRSQLSVNRADMVARTKKYKYMFIRMESVWRQDWTEKRTKGCGSEAFTTNLILASFSQNPVCPGVLTTRQQQPPSSFFIVFIQGYENRENTQHFCLCVQYILKPFLRDCMQTGSGLEIGIISVIQTWGSYRCICSRHSPVNVTFSKSLI